MDTQIIQIFELARCFRFEIPTLALDRGVSDLKFIPTLALVSAYLNNKLKTVVSEITKKRLRSNIKPFSFLKNSLPSNAIWNILYFLVSVELKKLCVPNFFSFTLWNQIFNLCISGMKVCKFSFKRLRNESLQIFFQRSSSSKNSSIILFKLLCMFYYFICIHLSPMGWLNSLLPILRHLASFVWIGFNLNPGPTN